MITGHGDDIYDYSGIIKHNFSSNVFHGIQMPGLKEHLAGCMACIDHYPPAEARDLERMLSRKHRNGQEENLVTNGATEAIYLIAQVTGRRCRSAILAPTFSEYEDACRMHGHEICHIKSLDEVTDNMQMVWFCNPNNPTGSLIPREKVVEAAFEHPRTVFVIDQSYEFFCMEELLQPREATLAGNIIQLHSMTKKYSIPGLRLGYVTGPQPLVQTLRGGRMPWSVNALAQEACRYILQHESRFDFDMQAYLAEAQRLRNAINQIGEGIEAMPTHTNFILLRMEGEDSLVMKRKLVDRYGILIRSAHNFVGLDRQYIRIAAQSEEENNLLISALKELFAEKNKMPQTL